MFIGIANVLNIFVPLDGNLNSRHKLMDENVIIEYVNAQQIMTSWLSSESRDYVAKSKQTVAFQDVTQRHKVARRKDDRK